MTALRPTGARALRRRRAALFALVVATVVSAVPPVPAQANVEESPKMEAPRFREVGRVPIASSGRLRGADQPVSTARATGWLILNPASRRGYTVAETGFGNTVIESFDLDTLQVRSQAVLPGIPIAGGTDDQSAGQTDYSGDVVHAVDPVARRIYLPLGTAGSPQSLLNVDRKRLAFYFAVIDEDLFDRDPERAFGAFSFPLDQKHLQAYGLMGMTVSRHHVASGDPGKLVLAFAPNAAPSVLPATATPIPGAYDHQLAQWDVSEIPSGDPAVASLHLAAASPAARADWAAILTPCATVPMTASAGGEAPSALQKTYQWGVLATADAVLTGCQTAVNSGAVVRVAVDRRTGAPTPELQRAVSLGKPVGDVLVDEGAERLVLRSYGNDGTTLWVFDAAEMRFTGSVAGHVVPVQTLGVGVDSASGRLYTLAANTCAPRAGTATLGAPDYVPVRGGLHVTEAGLDPVPAPENVVPDLAAHSHWRIGVDPVRRRVFVRRGMSVDDYQDHYPSCENLRREKTEVETFYRVYDDLIPPAAPPGALDDSTLTTDVQEDQARTQASYLGAGSGYGSRSVLTGGIDAATRGMATSLRSPCGREDREVLAGSVGKVEVSDQVTAAEAAALDADGRTRENLGDPVTRCRPQAPSASFGGRNVDELNDCFADVRELSFDQADDDAQPPQNGDCPTRDGDNRYEARCLGTRNAGSPGFDDQDHVAPRDGLRAEAACDDKEEKAKASSTASLASDRVEQARGQAAGADQESGFVRVAHSSSVVSVSRKLGKGVTVKVDSIARGVDIAGVGTIGVVRAEAVSTSTGRDGRASTSFTRTICDVEVRGFVVAGCLGSERQQQTFVEHLNAALAGRGTARLRNPDPSLAAGTPHGYLAGIQRDRRDLFADQVVNKDRSLAVPALEVVLYQGDGGPWGAGRQVVHLAGVQATTSYGIACMYGKRIDGACAAADEEAGSPGSFEESADASSSDTSGTSDGSTATAFVGDVDGGTTASLPLGSAKESVLTRLLRAVPRAVAEALRLLFNNPRELGLLAALWALLYAPCYLGDRRRAVRSVAARRLTTAT